MRMIEFGGHNEYKITAEENVLEMNIEKRVLIKRIKRIERILFIEKVYS